jgi:hypothetical protein
MDLSIVNTYRLIEELKKRPNVNVVETGPMDTGVSLNMNMAMKFTLIVNNLDKNKAKMLEAYVEGGIQ